MRKKKKTNYTAIVVSGFIVFIMVTSVIGFISQGSTSGVQKYNGQKFSPSDTGWTTNYEGNQYTFSYPPGDVEFLEFPQVSYQGLTQIDLTYDPNSSYKEHIAGALFELTNLLATRGVFVRPGFTQESEFNLPIITCETATQFVPVLYFSRANKTSVIYDNNCLRIEASTPTVVLQYADRIAYEIMGIIS